MFTIPIHALCEREIKKLINIIIKITYQYNHKNNLLIYLYLKKTILNDKMIK